jgi:hypothetical protein
MKLFGMCINWKVVAAVVAIAVGLFVFTPKLAAAALPLLVVAICPLSMLLAMGLMGRMNRGNHSTSAPDNGNQGSVPSSILAETSMVEIPIGRREQLAQLKAQQQVLSAKITALEEGPTTQALPKQTPRYDD